MALKITESLIKSAQASEEKYGIPASITLGQMILESSGSYKNGMSALAYEHKNLFGVKGEGSAGSVLMTTNEETKDGKTYKTYSKFRKYSSYEESIDDHSRLLTNDHYSKYLSSASTVEDYATGLQKAGYATDSKYADKLLSVIESNNLTLYDSGNYSGGLLNGDTTSDDRFKFTGDLVRFILIAFIFILAIVFFLKSFDIGGGDVLKWVTP